MPPHQRTLMRGSWLCGGSPAITYACAFPAYVITLLRIQHVIAHQARTQARTNVRPANLSVRLCGETSHTFAKAMCAYGEQRNAIPPTAKRTNVRLRVPNVRWCASSMHQRTPSQPHRTLVRGCAAWARGCRLVRIYTYIYASIRYIGRSRSAVWLSRGCGNALQDAPARSRKRTYARACACELFLISQMAR